MAGGMGRGAGVLMFANDGDMASCRLRATFLSNYTELQAGGNASITNKNGN